MLSSAIIVLSVYRLMRDQQWYFASLQVMLFSALVKISPKKILLCYSYNPRISTLPPAATPAITINVISKSKSEENGEVRFFSAAVEVIFNPISVGFAAQPVYLTHANNSGIERRPTLYK